MNADDCSSAPAMKAMKTVKTVMTMLMTAKQKQMRPSKDYTPVIFEDGLAACDFISIMSD